MVLDRADGKVMHLDIFINCHEAKTASGACYVLYLWVGCNQINIEAVMFLSYNLITVSKKESESLIMKQACLVPNKWVMSLFLLNTTIN